MYNRVWSRTVSRILSVSALAWPFGVITGKCVQAPAEDSVKKYFLREAVYISGSLKQLVSVFTCLISV